jgi:hypothetical protein
MAEKERASAIVMNIIASIIILTSLRSDLAMQGRKGFRLRNVDVAPSGGDGRQQYRFAPHRSSPSLHFYASCQDLTLLPPRSP